MHVRILMINSVYVCASLDDCIFCWGNINVLLAI